MKESTIKDMDSLEERDVDDLDSDDDDDIDDQKAPALSPSDLIQSSSPQKQEDSNSTEVVEAGGSGSSTVNQTLFKYCVTEDSANDTSQDASNQQQTDQEEAKAAPALQESPVSQASEDKVTKDQDQSTTINEEEEKKE